MSSAAFAAVDVGLLCKCAHVLFDGCLTCSWIDVTSGSEGRCWRCSVCAACLWHCFGLQCFVCRQSPNSLTLCYILLAVAIFCLCNILAKQAATAKGIGVCKLSCVNWHYECSVPAKGQCESWVTAWGLTQSTGRVNHLSGCNLIASNAVLFLRNC